MAYVPANYTGNGSTVNFSFSFEYIDNEEVSVTVDGVVQIIGTDFNVAGNIITFTSAPANDTAIVIFRTTDSDENKATFQNPFTINSEDINLNDKQLLFLAQEFLLNLDRIDVDLEGIKNEIGGIGGDYQIGDVVETVRDLDLNVSFVREKTFFDRATYSELDTLLGEYFPDDYDFTNEVLTTLDLPDSDNTASITDNTGVGRQYGLINNNTTFFLLRKETISFVNAENLTLSSTLNVIADHSFIQLQNIGSDVYVVLSSNISNEIKIGKVDIPLGNINVIHTIPCNFSNHRNFFNCSIVDTPNNYFYVFYANILVSSADLNRASSCVIKVMKDDSAWFGTQLLFPTASLTVANYSRSSISAYCYKDKLNLYSVKTTVSLPNDRDYIIEVDDSLLNSVDNTFTEATLLSNNLNEVGKYLSLGSSDATSAKVNGQSKYILDTAKNELVVLGRYDEEGSASPKSFNYTVIDLIDYSVKHAFTVEDVATSVANNNTSVTFTHNIWAGNLDYIVEDAQYVALGNKIYQPIVFSTDITGQGVMFVNHDSGKFEMPTFRSHSRGTSTNLYYGTNNTRMVVKDGKELYFMDGNGSSTPESERIRKVELVDDTVTNTTRPAPATNSIAPIKGYIKAK